MTVKIRQSSNPLLVFIVFWAFVFIIDVFMAKSPFLSLYEFSDAFYSIMLCVLISWVLGSVIARFIFPYIYRIFSTFDFYALSEKKALSIFLYCMFFFVAIRLLEFMILTGSPLPWPDNLEQVRNFVTEEGGSMPFPFISMLNNFFFFFPCLILVLKKRNFVVPLKFTVVGWALFVLYIYLSTARSSIFVAILLVFFLSFYFGVKFRYLLFAPALFFLLFGVIGSLVGKEGFDIFFVYLLAPLHAFDVLISGFDLGVDILSFRPIQPLLIMAGIIDGGFHLIPYVYTPLPVNVYTVFGVYYYDYGLLGLIFFIFIFSFLSQLFHLAALKYKSERLFVLSSLLLSLIVLGVFYDYYTSSMFVWLAFPFVALFFPSTK